MGNYIELLSHITISLCKGRHCCLWCLVKSDQLKIAPSVRGPVQQRTTESIVQDHTNFVCDGQNMKRAKLFNNAINNPFFPCIPLDQVMPELVVECT